MGKIVPGSVSEQSSGSGSRWSSEECQVAAGRAELFLAVAGALGAGAKHGRRAATAPFLETGKFC